MVGFLNGLFGGLKGMSGKLGKAASILGDDEDDEASGGGLLSSLSALTGTPKTAAAAPGAGGVPGASEAGATDSIWKGGPFESILGATVGPASAAPTAAPAAPGKKPGFFTRINTVDPATGLSTVDKWDRFASTLMDVGDDGEGRNAAAFDKRIAARKTQADRAALNAQIDQLFPDDPKMRFLLKANPEKATQAIADAWKSANETVTMSPGSVRHGPTGENYMAPQYGQADGFSYSIGKDGFNWGGQRPQTWGELESGRHNRESEQVSRGQLDVSRGNLGVAQGNLGVARDRLGFDRSRVGAGGAGDVSDEEILRALGIGGRR